MPRRKPRVALEPGDAAIMFRDDGTITLYIPEETSPRASESVLRARACMEMLRDESLRAQCYAKVLSQKDEPSSGEPLN